MILYILKKIKIVFLFLFEVKIAETVFTLSEKNLELYEAELQAPGREIAYISKARGFVK